MIVFNGRELEIEFTVRPAPRFAIVPVREIVGEPGLGQTVIVFTDASHEIPCNCHKGCPNAALWRGRARMTCLHPDVKTVCQPCRDKIDVEVAKGNLICSRCWEPCTFLGWTPIGRS